MKFEVEDPFYRICVPNEMKDVNLKLSNMINGINEPKTLIKHISCECRYTNDGKKCYTKQKWSNGKCQCKRQKPLKRCIS